ncbi:MAG: hypothetical protein ACTS8Y_02610 [Arsenophonus sp. ER-EMS1-MAG3]
MITLKWREKVYGLIQFSFMFKLKSYKLSDTYKNTCKSLNGPR